jgi:peptidoglycan/LPS O-acetylase OafA/YrhL
VPEVSARSSAANASASAAQRAELPLPHRLPSLDGWRAISIILVLGLHSTITAGFPLSLTRPFKIFDGDLGVRCFFVISGFLITWLMLGEHEREGKISLRRFFIRRALRILPVYFAFMAVLWLLHLFTPFNQTRGAWIANVTFTTDFFAPSLTSAHLWSLSVEEQFYLLWPLLFAVFALGTNPRAALQALAVPLMVAPLWRVITYKELYPASLHLLFSHFSFFNYFDCLAIGCMCAILLRHWRDLLQVWVVNRSKRTAVLALVLILLPYLLSSLPVPGRVVAGSRASFQAVGFGLLLLQSVLLTNAKLYSVLNWNWMRHLGVLSYSLYIWQQIFCTRPEVFGLGQVWWMSFPGWLVPVIVVAHISYYLLERPLFQLRSRFR